MFVVVIDRNGDHDASWSGIWFDRAKGCVHADRVPQVPGASLPARVDGMVDAMRMPAAGPTSDDPPARTLPLIDRDNREYWTGGADGELRIHRCRDCRYYVHPPVRFCPRCESRDVAAEAVSGRGIVASFTVNHKQWVAGLPERYVLALVSIVEQEDVRLVANIVNCDPDSVAMDMAVRVLFEPHEDLWIPFFEPDAR